MIDVIIIGNGPAGISAALYLQRGGLNSCLIGKDGGALEKAHLIENYYGLSRPVSGKELHGQGLRQAEQLGAKVIQDEVVGVGWQGEFIVNTKKEEYKAPVLLLTTGASRNTPNIRGVKEFEGKGVSYCAVCDAFFYRNRPVAVLGSGSYAVHEALALLPTSSSVTLLTNGQELKEPIPKDLRICRKEISSLSGDSLLREVNFQDGTSLAVDGLFVAVGVASSSDLARKLGVQMEPPYIVVNERMETNVPGLYAAGDCTGGLLQIAKAVYEGAKAGTEIVRYFRRKQEK